MADQGLLDLFGEETLAADLGQRSVEDTVSRRLDNDDVESALGKAMGLHQPGPNLEGLSQRQGGAAGADADLGCLQAVLSGW